MLSAEFSFTSQKKIYRKLFFFYFLLFLGKHRTDVRIANIIFPDFGNALNMNPLFFSPFNDYVKN